MKLQNSYIFLDNPYKKEEPQTKVEGNTIVLNIGNSLYSYIKRKFPTIMQSDEYDLVYKKKYFTDLKYDDVVYKVEYIITEVVGTEFLDVIVEGKSKATIIKVLEYVQSELFDSGIGEDYVDIITYDAVSEYYCNKMYPKLNTLERNLRKLLFNIYIVNFGRDYYKMTIDEAIQKKIKGVVGVDSSKEQKDKIKTNYHTSNKKEIEEIERLQRFFYSLEYTDVQKLLFTSSWTSVDETAKTKFLEEQLDLSKLSDEELRKAFSQLTPKSDWERFFSSKIEIQNIEELIDAIRTYRNVVAHFKFFYKNEYDECNKKVSQLNKAILKAIQITEEKDFAEKNSEALKQALKGMVESFEKFKKSLEEMVLNVAKKAMLPAFTGISKYIQSSTWIGQTEKSEVNE